MLFASGARNSGLSLFVLADRLVFDYNIFGDHHLVESDRPVPEGPSEVGVRFRRHGTDGTATLVIDGEPCATLPIPFVMRMMSSIGHSVGRDAGSPVSTRYDGEFPFAGRLRRVDIELVAAAAGAKGGDGATAERAAMGRQ